MKLTNISLSVKVDDINHLSDVKKALKRLDLELKGDTSDFNEDYKKRATKGRVVARYIPGSKAEINEVEVEERGEAKEKRERVVITLGNRRDLIPSVSVNGLSRLGDDYEIQYSSGRGLDIIYTGEENPTFYFFNSGDL